MGLMSGNPFYSGNPWASALDGIRAGMGEAEAYNKNKRDEEIAKELRARQEQEQVQRDELYNMKINEYQKVVAEEERMKGIQSQFATRTASGQPLTAMEAAGFIGQNSNLAPAVKQYADMQPKREEMTPAKAMEIFTPESVEMWRQTGKTSDLRRYEKPENKETWSEPTPMSIGGKNAIVQKSSNGQIRPVIQDSAPRITMNTGDRADLYEKKAAFGELPKLRQDAAAAVQVMPKLKRMTEILDSGNSGDTVAYMRRILAPYAPESKGANEAQLFQIYARTISGPQRVNIIGTGPQTEKEGELLFKVGGGGNQGRSALRELLQMHSNANTAKIDEYNGMVEAAGTKIYKPMTTGGNSTSGKRKPLSAY